MPLSVENFPKYDSAFIFDRILIKPAQLAMTGTKSRSSEFRPDLTFTFGVIRP